MKLRIIHKGLLLLLLPFAIETALFGYLYTLNQRAEELAANLRSRNQYLHYINFMLEYSGVAWASVLNRASSINAKNSFIELTADQYRATTQEQINQAKNIKLDSPRVQAILSKAQELQEVQGEALEILEQNPEAFSDFDRMQILMSRFASVRKRLRRSREMLLEIQTLIYAEHREMEETMRKDSEQREHVKTLLLAGFLGQLALTASLLAVLLYNITNRLNSLVKNAENLPTGKPLTTKVKGNDEIAYLDTVLHNASDKLEEAAQNRQSIMNMIAHDIRSPLMSSNILLEELTDEVNKAPTERAQKTTSRLRSVFSQLFILVEDLLAIDKLESGTLELDLSLHNLKDLVGQSIDTLRPQAEKRGIKLANKMPDVEVVLDEGRILQVLNNYISNAIKFSKDNSTVEIQGDIGSKSVTVAVMDTGKGINKADLPHVFDKFFQASEGDGKKKGFGLGLAICKRIIEAHRGELGAESETGKGSAFWFSLPID